LSATTDALLATAAARTAEMKSAAEQARADADVLFAESAVATAAYLKARGSAARLAEVNKDRKSGYGSPAAVVYHGLTGNVLGLPDGGFDGTAKSVQTKVKAIYQFDADLARAIVKKAKTVQDAVDALTEAKPATTLADHLAKARKALEDAAEFRVNGAEYDDAARQEMDVILAAIDLVVAPQSVTVSQQAEVVAA
jgi:hypothetical protein